MKLISFFLCLVAALLWTWENTGTLALPINGNSHSFNQSAPLEHQLKTVENIFCQGLNGECDDVLTWEEEQIRQERLRQERLAQEREAEQLAQKRLQERLEEERLRAAEQAATMARMAEMHHGGPIPGVETRIHSPFQLSEVAEIRKGEQEGSPHKNSRYGAYYPLGFGKIEVTPPDSVPIVDNSTQNTPQSNTNQPLPASPPSSPPSTSTTTQSQQSTHRWLQAINRFPHQRSEFHPTVPTSQQTLMQTVEPVTTTTAPNQSSAQAKKKSKPLWFGASPTLRSDLNTNTVKQPQHTSKAFKPSSSNISKEQNPTIHSSLPKQPRSSSSFTSSSDSGNIDEPERAPQDLYQALVSSAMTSTSTVSESTHAGNVHHYDAFKPLTLTFNPYDHSLDFFGHPRHNYCNRRFSFHCQDPVVYSPSVSPSPVTPSLSPSPSPPPSPSTNPPAAMLQNTKRSPVSIKSTSTVSVAVDNSIGAADPGQPQDMMDDITNSSFEGSDVSPSEVMMSGPPVKQQNLDEDDGGADVLKGTHLEQS